MSRGLANCNRRNWREQRLLATSAELQGGNGFLPLKNKIWQED